MMPTRHLVAASIAALAVAASLSPPAGAQTTAAEDPRAYDGDRRPTAQALQEGVEVRVLNGGRADDASGGARPAVDESALRYYAARGERERVNAETARLRALHPGWEPPDNLWGPAHRVDEGPLWRLYDQGNYDAVRTEIARLERAHPGWGPPASLLALMDENEVRARLQVAEVAEDWAGLLAIANAHPGEISCNRIDNMWRVARAQAALGRRDEAYAIYDRIIANCADVDHRVATLQKAKDQTSRAQLERLFTREDTRPKSSEERAKVAAVRRDLAAPSSSQPAAIQRLFEPRLTRGQAERAEGGILQQRHAKGAEMLGWFYYDSGDPETALSWFERAHAWAPSAKTAEGLALSYGALGAFDKVERLAERWPEALAPTVDGLRTGRVAAAYESGNHAAVLALTEGARRSGELLLRGWSLMKLERPTEALAAFHEAAARFDNNPNLRSDALYACALAHLATNTLRDAVAMTEVPGVSPEHRRLIRAQVLERQASLAFERGDYRRAHDYLHARYAFAEPSRELLIREAWTWYHLRQPVRAERIFARLHRELATPETEQGLRVTRGRIDGIEYGPAPVRAAARAGQQPWLRPAD